MPSTNGFGTARAIAKLYGILANGGIDGESVLVSKKSITLLNHPVRHGPDLIIGMNMTHGLGVTHFYSKDDEVRENF